MSPDKPKPTLQRIILDEIAPGPVLRDQLSESQLATLRAIHAVVAPHVSSFDDFELGFRRDVDPDSELRIWTGIAMAYQRFNEIYPAARPDEREAAFTAVLLLMSNEEGPSPQVPELIWKRCEDIVAALPVEAIPITVIGPRR